MRDDQRPGDQRRRLAGPAGLNGQRVEVDVVTLQDHLLHRRATDGLGLHGHDGLQERQHVDRLAQTARRLRLAQEGQGLTHLAELMRLPVHAPSDPLDRAEEVGQDGHGGLLPAVVGDVLEEHRRPAFGEEAGLNLGDLEHGGDRCRDAAQAVAAFQQGDEIAQGTVGHKL